MKSQKKEPVEIVATLDLIPDVSVSDDNPERGVEDLSPEEIARRTTEKAALLGSLRANAPVRDSAAIAMPTVADGPIEVPSSPALEAATADVEEIDAELAALAREQDAAERARAEDLKRAEQEHQAKLDGLQRKRNEAEAKAHKLRQRQAAVELATLTKAAAQEEVREQARQHATREEKTAALAARVTPLLDMARSVLKELQTIAKESGPTLEKLSSMTWKSVSSRWPIGLRRDFENQIVCHAVKQLSELNNMLQGLQRLIPRAESLVARGWSPTLDTMDVNEVVQCLGYAKDYVRPVREALADLHDKLATIFEQGEHLAGPQPEPEVIVTANIREQAKNRLLADDHLRQLGFNPAVLRQKQADLGTVNDL